MAEISQKCMLVCVALNASFQYDTALRWKKQYFIPIPLKWRPCVLSFPLSLLPVPSSLSFLLLFRLPPPPPPPLRLIWRVSSCNWALNDRPRGGQMIDWPSVVILLMYCILMYCREQQSEVEVSEAERRLEETVQTHSSRWHLPC